MRGRCVGEHNGKAKLTEEMVLEIRRCRPPYALIAEKFRVSSSTVGDRRTKRAGAYRPRLIHREERRSLLGDDKETIIASIDDEFELASHARLHRTFRFPARLSP